MIARFNPGAAAAPIGRNIGWSRRADRCTEPDFASRLSRRPWPTRTAGERSNLNVLIHPRRLTNAPMMNGLPSSRAACHAATTGGPQWHPGLAIRSVRPAYRAHVMVPFAELQGRLEY
jgi:hypothetical protein